MFGWLWNKNYVADNQNKKVNLSVKGQLRSEKFVWKNYSPFRPSNKENASKGLYGNFDGNENSMFEVGP